MKIWLDNDGNGTLDAGDDVQVDDDFNSGTLVLTYDNNGNLTGDGVSNYTYDAWNRLRTVSRQAGGDTTAVASYTYDGQNRRQAKVVSHCGPTIHPHDGGDETVHYYYSSKWQIVETRNGSNAATAQFVWGTRYVDELVFFDVNGDPALHNDCDPDATGSDPNDASPDRRYFAHQDRNWNVVALTEYAGDGEGTDGRVAERYAYTPYGEFVVLKGDAGSGELGQVLPTSLVGNVFLHQGLPFDAEKLSYQNRWREYACELQRFEQRDPRMSLLEDGPSDSADWGAYAYIGGSPVKYGDPSGMIKICSNPPSGNYCAQPYCENGHMVAKITSGAACTNPCERICAQAGEQGLVNAMSAANPDYCASHNGRICYSNTTEEKTYECISVNMAASCHQNLCCTLPVCKALSCPAVQALTDYSQNTLGCP